MSVDLHVMVRDEVVLPLSSGKDRRTLRQIQKDFLDPAKKICVVLLFFMLIHYDELLCISQHMR